MKIELWDGTRIYAKQDIYTGIRAVEEGLKAASECDMEQFRSHVIREVG